MQCLCCAQVDEGDLYVEEDDEDYIPHTCTCDVASSSYVDDDED